MNLDVNVRKTSGEHHKIRGEEFQRVGRSNNIYASFSLYINYFNPDFQNLDFFLLSYNPLNINISF